jgi:pyruvate formate lyase activating enzyme
MDQRRAISPSQDRTNGLTEEIRGTIFDVKRFAVHDGPGIRTTVFLKGCPLACLWCHNPESISRRPQLVYNPQRCIGCGRCYEVCPQGVHALQDGDRAIDWGRCVACGTCAKECFAGALEIAGREVTVQEAMAQVALDRPFYQRSGGGMTLSGGEPLAQYAFTRALLARAKAEGVHTALDTSGYAPWARLEALLSDVNLVLYDLKHMDSERHRALTGVPNERILENLRRLDAVGQPIWVRIPLIPGANDGQANYEALGQFLSGLQHVAQIEILRYHRLAECKYEQIGSAYRLQGLASPSEAQAESRRQILMRYGLRQTVVR